MKAHLTGIAALCLLALSQGCARYATIEHAGLTREYMLHVPPDCEPGMPLVLALHGGGGTAAGFARYTGLSELADEMGFIVVFPQGLDRTWYDSIHTTAEPSKASVDDTGFLVALTECIRDAYGAGPAFVLGLSNGGMLTQELLVTHGSVFSGGASIASQMPAGFTACATCPVPVLFMNGSDDPIVPYLGGTITLPWGETRGEVLPTDENVRMWLRWNNLGDEPRVTELADTCTDDGATARIMEWGDDGSSKVVLYTVEGGGHTLPGARQYLPPGTVGNTCRDFDGARAIMDFFRGLECCQ